MCKDKRSGGLGVKSLFWFNKALLSKWCWRFAIERGPFWNEVIRGKYGEQEGGWCTLYTIRGVWIRFLENNPELLAGC